MDRLDQKEALQEVQRGKEVQREMEFHLAQKEKGAQREMEFHLAQKEKGALKEKAALKEILKEVLKGALLMAVLMGVPMEVQFHYILVLLSCTLCRKQQNKYAR